MALCHFPSFFIPPNKFNNPHLKCGTHHYPLHKNLTLACSAEKSRKKEKGSKPSKSNEELCNELREFMLAMGIPENRVPLTKELSENGRKDLANIVRRRGYKLITELLRNSFKNDSDIEKHSIEDQNFSNACSDEAPEAHERILLNTAESLSSPTVSSMMENYVVRTNGPVTTDTSLQICESSQASVLSLHSKAANFVLTGKLDISEEAFEIESGEMPAGSEQRSGSTSSDNPDNTAYVDFQGVALLTQQTDRDQVISNWGLKGVENDENLNSEVSERIDQAEINRLKALLHQKEMELLELKRQIEKEKQSLCILQAKADEEIGNAHRMVTDKEMELRAAEESLSGLKEVQIEYWGNAETVEVAGSFNGWHNRIKMDLQPSSKPVDQACSRNLKLWSAILWLYPGIYEIKFIADGTWMVDPNREISTSCNITNNVLRVER